MVYSWRVLACIVVGLLTLAAPGMAQNRVRYPLPTGTVSESLGVNIHFTDPQPDEMAQLANAGFRWIRMDLGWNGIERTKGQYDFAAFDRLLAALEPHHIRPIFILDYGNDLYEKGAPRSAEARTAFTRFVKAAVTRFKDRGVLWEMWNEPNGQFWMPRANVEEYITLAMAVGKTIREAAPEEWYIGPAVSGMDFAFLERCFKAGLLNYWDAVSFHPYRNTPPETAATDYARLRQILARFAAKGEGAEATTVPLISGEWGYSELYPGLSLELQSKYIVREMLTNLANDVPLSIWYDWHDDGTDPKEIEHHFGTVYSDYRPKPTYTAIQTLANELKGYTFNKRLRIGHADDYCLLFTKGSDIRLAVWTANSQKSTPVVTIPASAGMFDVSDYTGAKSTISADAGGLKLTLTDAPHYLSPQTSNELLSIARLLYPLKSVYVTDDEIMLFEANRQDTPELFQWIGRKGAKTEWIFGYDTADTTAERHYPLPPIMAALKETKHKIKLFNRTETGMRTTVTLKRAGLPAIVQETLLLPRSPLRVVMQPTGKNTLMARVENPSGKAFRGDIANQGIGKATPLVMADGQYAQSVSLPVKSDGRNYSAHILIREIPEGSGAKPRTVLETPTLTLTPLETFSRYALKGKLPKTDYQVVADGKPEVKSEIKTTVVSPPTGLPGSMDRAVQISYHFEPGWKFMRLEPEGERQKPLSGKPTSLGLWIYSDGSGDALRMRFTDSTGQTFQPDGGELNWKGWKYVEFSLRGDSGGHWGGANDGIVYYPIHLDTLLLVDSPGGRGGNGVVTMTGVTLVEKK